jgi:hypothetical protein
MWISRGSARVLIGLCLLLMQAQLLAASTLGCLHLADPAAGGDAKAGCSFHQAAAGISAGQAAVPPLECQKCALHCAVGTSGLLLTTIDFLGPLAPDVPEAAANRHYYSFSPDSFLRPPKSVSI